MDPGPYHVLTPLMAASANGHLAVVEALVRAGADKEAKDLNGCTPLIIASDNGRLTVVEALVRAGADKEAKDKNGYTPLLSASTYGRLTVVEVLIRAGAEKEAKVNGGTALMAASHQGYLGIVEALARTWPLPLITAKRRSRSHGNKGTRQLPMCCFGVRRHLATFRQLARRRCTQRRSGVSWRKWSGF